MTNINQKKQVKFVTNQHNATFFPILKQRVDSYFIDNNISKHFNTTMVVKTVVLLAAYIVPFIVLLWLQPSFWVGSLLWILMGLGMAGVGMSVMHDANHGAYTASKTANRWIGYSLNLFGGMCYNWQLQHNVLHHTYTNITHLDDDIQDKAILKMSPHTPVKNVHRFQYIYAVLFYAIVTLYWALAKDFAQYIRYRKTGVNTNSKRQNAVLLTKMIAIKVVYLFAFFGVPALVGLPFYQVLAGFLLMHFTAGIILTVVFQLAHTVEDTTHPMPTAQGTIENSWAIHQLNTTVNFSRHNKLLSWYLGGLNYQVEHHLFPRICHVHYPEIAHIVKSTAEEFGVPYLENPTFAIALRSHFSTLKRFGNLPTMDEAIG
jgi:linoleoyl-CoA desaturase